MQIPDTTPIAFGGRLMELISAVDFAEILSRHRAKAEAIGLGPAGFTTHTRALVATGQVVEIITQTRYLSQQGDTLATVCALATEWQDITGEAPPRQPRGAREN